MNKQSGFYKNGKSHAEGGIPVLVDDNTLIEVEKFEYVICNNAMNSTKIFEFKDKTNKEILDEIFRYSDCEFEQHKANSGDFIICKLAVMDKKKRNITGTAKEIINVMQSENSCNVSNDSKEFKDGGEIEFKAKNEKYFEYVPISEIEKYKEFDRANEKKWGNKDNTLDKLIDDIKENGIKTPITLQVDLDNNALITEGNTRLAAAKHLGFKYIPVRIINGKFGSINKHKTKKIEKIPLGKMEVFYPNVRLLDYDNSPARYGFNSLIKMENGGEVNNETYTKWKNLVNMSKSELEKFYESKEGKEAGLSSSEAKEQGISSGRESARWIMKMKDTPKSEWTPTMWKWANKQISFISRMSGMKGGLYDDKGNKTRKHTSLLIWGHNPKKYNNGGELNKNEMENKENKTHTYALTLRPFDIGTYPKENFIRFVEEEEDNYKFGLLEYSKELPIETIKHYSLAPVSDLMKYDDKEIYYYDNLKAKIEVLKNESNIPYVKAIEFDENNEVIDETEISGQNFLENVNKGNYKLVDDSELAKGIKVESEHKETAEKLYNQEITPEQAAESIAKEHLSESPDYYKELDKMEEKLKNTKMEINTNIVTNWDEVPKVWRNIEKVKKVNFVNSPYNKDLIKLITPFTGDDNLRPILSGIHFDENGITATDAHKLINLPYPNKDFNGTYATVPKKFLKDDKSIKNDLFSGNYPNYKAVIPTSDKAERVQEISVYKLLQYTEVALHYASQSNKQIAFSLGDISYGLNGEFLIEVLKTALKLGHEKLYAFTTTYNRAIVFSDNKNYELGKDLIFLIMPVMLLDDYDHKGKKYERPLGTQDLDWGREITVYYDFSKDAIVNQDGSIAEFKMNYGEYDVINPNEINILKNFEGKNNTIPVLDYFKVQGNKIIAANLNQSFITIKKVNLKDGLYQIRDNAVEFDPTFTLSSYEEYPKPQDRSEKRLEFSINSDVLLHYVKIALDYVGHDDLRPVMSGMLFDYVDGKLFIVATDAHKLLKINITRFVNIEKQDNFQFILSTINLLKVLDNINESVLTIKATKELAIIESDEFEFESRLIDGKYPAYNQVISAFKNKKLIINIKDLFTCIKSKEAESFVKSNKGEDILIYDKLKSESELSINLGFKESGYSNDIKIAESVEICKVDYKLENGDYQTKDNLVLLMPIFNNEGEHFMFNYKFFKTVLETLNCEDVELFYDEKNRAYIFGGDCFGYESTIKAKKKEVTKKSVIDVENETANVINEIFNEWEKIKNESQHEKWSNKVNSLRFGTYKNQNILDVIEKFSPKYPNEVIKKDFIKELYKSLKIELPENLKFKTEIKEQSNEQKELKEAINTFEELIKLGGTDAEMKEWQEAIETFKMLI